MSTADLDGRVVPVMVVVLASSSYLLVWRPLMASSLLGLHRRAIDVKLRIARLELRRGPLSFEPEVRAAAARRDALGSAAPVRLRSRGRVLEARSLSTDLDALIERIEAVAPPVRAQIPIPKARSGDVVLPRERRITLAGDDEARRSGRGRARRNAH